MRKYFERLLQLVMLGGCVSAVAAQSPTMLRDINTSSSLVGPGTQSVPPPGPLALTRVGDRAYFFAYEPLHGYELWKTDGTVAGTVLVKDINPGPEGSALTVDDRSMYLAWHRVNGGLDHIDHIRPFPYEQMTATADGTVYFFAYRPSTGAELWKTDGTEEGTVLVKDIWPGPASGTQGTLFFNAIEEPVLSMTAMGNLLYFTANDGQGGPGLWVSDGTGAGTSLVARVNMGGLDFTGPRCLAAISDKVFFAGNDGVHGYEPWIFDPETNHVSMLFDLNIAPNNATRPEYAFADSNGMPVVHTPLVVADKLYFFGSLSGIGSGVQLSVFVLDHGVIDVAADAASAGGTVLADFGLVASGGRVYYAARGGGAWPSVYAHDPSGELPNGTPCTDVSSTGLLSPSSPAESNGTLYFVGYQSAGWELWKTLGAPSNTALIRDLNPGSNAGVAVAIPRGAAARSYPIGGHSRPATIFAQAGACYFAGTSSGVDQYAGSQTGTNVTSNLELYRSNGTASGTVLLKEIISGPAPSLPGDFVALGPTTFLFTANNRAGGRDLWVSDGSSAGTFLLRSFETVWGPGSTPRSFVEVPGKGVFFSAEDAVHGRELWQSDGTTGGTVLLGDIEPGESGSSPAYLTAGRSRLFFGAKTAATGFEVWTSDGTVVGTTLSKDLSPGPSDGFAVTDGSGSPVPGGGFAVLNDQFLFVGRSGSAGRELYSTDGSGTGTKRVRDIYLGSKSSLGWTNTYYAAFDQQSLIPPPPFLNTGSAVYFSALDSTAAVVVDDTLFPFSYNLLGDPTYAGGGGELWRTDGTPSGTVLAANINAIEVGGILGSNPRNLTRLENASLPSGSFLLYANDSWARAPWVNRPIGGSGDELWKYDAGTASASMLLDINPGPPDIESGSGGSFVDRPMAVLNGVAYFAADDGVNGTELWRSDGTTEGTWLVAQINPGAIGSDPGPFAVLSDRLVFPASSGVDGLYHMYSSDGTAAGTVLLASTVAVARGTRESATMAAHGGIVYFSGFDAEGHQGQELYRTDGVPGSVELVADLNPGRGDSAPDGLTSTSLGLFFSATDGVHGLEPWLLGGTAQCRADINGVGGVTVQDLFDFLADWFSQAPRGDFNHSGDVTIQDLFDFLVEWFAGC